MMFSIKYLKLKLQLLRIAAVLNFQLLQRLWRPLMKHLHDSLDSYPVKRFVQHV